jgi:hypothetical protein
VQLALLTFLSFLVSSQPACLQSIDKPSYPQIARNYDSQGTVTAHFTIGEDGRVQNAVYESKERITPEGNKTLANAVEHLLDSTHFDPQCKGDYTLVYRFTLNEQRSGDPHTTVTFNSPNEYVINANHDMIICSVYSTETPSWRKRVWSRLRRRGRPLTIITTECY